MNRTINILFYCIVLGTIGCENFSGFDRANPVDPKSTSYIPDSLTLTLSNDRKSVLLSWTAYSFVPLYIIEQSTTVLPNTSIVFSEIAKYQNTDDSKFSQRVNYNASIDPNLRGVNYSFRLGSFYEKENKSNYGPMASVFVSNWEVYPKLDMPLSYRIGFAELPNGKILVIGESSCILYDPITKQVTPTTHFGFMLRNYSLVTMDDGNILISGGYTEHGRVKSVQRYIYQSDRWEALAPMNEAKVGHYSVLLKDGRILVINNYNNSHESDISCEIYNPISRNWQITDSLINIMQPTSVTMLQNGKVLVTGLSGESEIFDPQKNEWTTAGHMINRRMYHTATLLNNGDVLVTGGDEENPPVDVTGEKSSCEIYRTTLGIWEGTNPLLTLRSGHIAKVLPSGKVLIIGGYYPSYLSKRGIKDEMSYGSVPMESCEIFDPIDEMLYETSPLSIIQNEYNAISLHSGQVLLIGLGLIPEMYTP